MTAYGRPFNRMITVHGPIPEILDHFRFPKAATFDFHNISTDKWRMPMSKHIPLQGTSCFGNASDPQMWAVTDVEDVASSESSTVSVSLSLLHQQQVGLCTVFPHLSLLIPHHSLRRCPDAGGKLASHAQISTAPLQGSHVNNPICQQARPLVQGWIHVLVASRCYVRAVKYQCVALTAAEPMDRVVERDTTDAQNKRALATTTTTLETLLPQAGESRHRPPVACQLALARGCAHGCGGFQTVRFWALSHNRKHRTIVMCKRSKS